MINQYKSSLFYDIIAEIKYKLIFPNVILGQQQLCPFTQVVVVYR